MPWLLKAVLLAAKSKRGRELLFTGALAAVELARSDRARELYSKARDVTTDPRLRKLAADAAHKTVDRIKR